MPPSTITFKSGFRNQCPTKWYAVSVLLVTPLLLPDNDKYCDPGQLPFMIADYGAQYYGDGGP